ncbi:MAG: DNA repair exonuclease [Chloroflexota bacterium]|nr:DNA repair exonuclease [Chloroflexota bacterium]
MRILCTGDIHIGRRASRLPDPLPGHLDAEQFSCAAAWGAVVDTALREQVDIVAISGDVVDRQNRYFEAVGPFERGLRHLADAGIEVVAVTGNHDFDVLPLLARGVASPHIRLLGTIGRWERYTVERSGAAVLHIDGWSFPSMQVLTNPLISYPAPPDDGVPVLGLLHADLDQSTSQYAPVALSDLRQGRVAAWLLGHVHHPRAITGPGRPLVLYPGSPMAMDPGETGAHGPWLLELAPGQPFSYRQIPTSCIRYETLSIVLDGIDEPGDLRDHISGSIQQRLGEIARDGGELACVSFRVTLTGRTPLHRELPNHLKEVVADFQPQTRSVTGFVDRVFYETRPAFDIDDLVKRNDPPGELARVLAALEAGAVSADCRGLLDDTMARLNEVRRHRTYGAIADDERPDHETARRHLLREGYRLLDTLVAQREQASP